MTKYAPPFSVLCSALGTTAEMVNKAESVTIKSSVLKKIISLMISDLDVDVDIYRRFNKDVDNHFEKKQDSATKDHFIATGYFESRTLPVNVDREYYMITYADIRRAVQAGSIKDPSMHFYATGYVELRAPNPEAEREVLQWQNILGVKP